MISPGPCTPNEAGVSVATIQAFAGQIPILGVCLGHQSIGQVFGGRIVHAREIMHGKTSMIYHRSQGVFAGLPQPFEATRYHSLVVDQVPGCLRLDAWTEDGVPMGIRHVSCPIIGVQFHPESILTEAGPKMIDNFIRLCGEERT